ncbi:MAG: NAD(P)H-hydrate epimerase [bacterium]
MHGQNHLRLAKISGGNIVSWPKKCKYSAIVDSLLGYNLKGDPRGKYAKLINWDNENSALIIPCDIPFGTTATNGQDLNSTIMVKVFNKSSLI